MKVSRRNESLRIKVGHREIKEVDHFKYLGSELKDGYCTRKIEMKIAIIKEAFNRKIPLLTTKQTSNSRRNWLDVMSRVLLYMAQRPEHKNI